MNIIELTNAIEDNDIPNIRKIFLQDDIKQQLDFENREEILASAIENECIEALELLIQMGCNINAKVPCDGIGYKLLEFACLCSKKSVVEWLLSKQCGLNNEAIIYAASKGAADIVKILLNAGVDVNYIDFHHRNALHWAVQEGYNDVVKELINHGCSLYQKDIDSTPLQIAVGENRFEIAKILLCSGDPILMGVSSSFQLACAYKYYQLSDLLLVHGADIDYIDEDGRTSLFHAIVVQDEKMIEYLFSKGASIDIVDYFGISIKDLDDEHIRNQIYEDLHGEQ